MNDAKNFPTVTIRPVNPADEPAVHAVIAAAFGQETEAGLVHDLRHCGALVLERVAETPDRRIVGHIAFSRVTGAGAGHRLHVSCLASLSVHPDFQRLGIGSQLVESSLADLRKAGEDLVLVLGPPAYYPRFGFDPVLAQKVHGPYAGNAFMAMALTEAGDNDLPVEVTFATPFEDFE
ncbi:GNAT family N-acetyltransferase [Polymorphum gilvum]|uniref:Acetyltransferase, GNAT family protein n=1 Tax=Polymorphum gilvum (strain LMG 25793 / CGMCC 1.9160 / SL003B-26A1) TaxID=991905 RepID=F2J2P7_POLGS|nr:N-acetyltransferase [Polymorphum gilvum]ADZ72071.1 Acetyltransferase, GNAT family protein [Polymorphum gilvum SL003B-26A1]